MSVQRATSTHFLREALSNGGWFALCGRRFKSGRYGDAPPSETPTCASCRALLAKRGKP